MAERTYIPALGFDWLTRFYDPLIAFTLRERTLKQRLLDQAKLAPGQRVLDVGCGTGTLAIMAAQREPRAQIVGLDGDAKVLSLARAKIEKAGVAVELREGLANDAAHFPAGSFDRVLTSLVLHHLTREEKLAALRAINSWLRPGGELHVLDFGPSDNPLLRLVSHGVALFDGEGRVRDNLEGKLPQLMREAGFASVDECGRAFTPFGSVSYYRATRS